MRPQSVLNAMNKIQGNGVPAPQANLPPTPSVGPITGAKATATGAAPLGNAPLDPTTTATPVAGQNFTGKTPSWKNYGGATFDAKQQS